MWRVLALEDKLLCSNLNQRFLDVLCIRDIKKNLNDVDDDRGGISRWLRKRTGQKWSKDQHLSYLRRVDSYKQAWSYKLKDQISQGIEPQDQR